MTAATKPDLSISESIDAFVRVRWNHNGAFTTFQVAKDHRPSSSLPPPFPGGAVRFRSFLRPTYIVTSNTRRNLMRSPDLSPSLLETATWRSAREGRGDAAARLCPRRYIFLDAWAYFCFTSGVLYAGVCTRQKCRVRSEF